MSLVRKFPSFDRRLTSVYHEVEQLSKVDEGALPPSYLELTGGGSRYSEEASIGAGATKEISKIYDNHSRKWVAIARPRRELGVEAYGAFIHEAWLTSSLSHPNIIKVYDVGIDAEGRPFYTMDLKGGRTFADWIGSGLCDLRQLLEVFLKVCDAVAYAHSRGILHLDLKPENIQVDAFGEVLVCDWGLGKSLGEESSEKEGEGGGSGESSGRHLTLTGEIRGTPGFMAPEQATWGAPKDVRTDGFALGCILYTILTGACAYGGADVDEIMEETRHGKVIAPKVRFPQLDIPSSLEAVVMTATVREPEHRYPSVSALRGDIGKYLAGYATEAEGKGFVRDFRLFVRRNRIASAVSFIGIVAVTVLTFFFVLKIEGEKDAASVAKVEAATLQAKSDTLESRLEDSLRRGKETAENIAYESKKRRDRDFMVSPLKAISDADTMTKAALLTDPECELARLEQFRIRTLRMDFAGALELVPVLDERYEVWSKRKIAELRSEWAFSVESRPSIEQVVEFLRESASMVTKKEMHYLRKTVVYDHTARKDREGYAEAVRAFLKMLNPDWDSGSFRYDEETRELEIGSENSFGIQVSPGPRTVVGLLDAKVLRLALQYPSSLALLSGLGFEVLDVRDCELDLNVPVSLPALKEVRIREGQVPEEELRKYLRSRIRFEIVEEPNDEGDSG